MAAEMLGEVEGKFGRSFLAAEFWECPTIAGLGKLVVEGRVKNSPLIFPVSEAGARTPLFYVLPGWYIPEAERLSRHLGSEQPLYAVVPDARPGGALHNRSRDEIVSACIDAIQNVQPRGPYALIGRSIGGSLAFEIAASLMRSGESVGFIGMLDTHYPGISSFRSFPAPLRYIEFVLGDLAVLPRSSWSKYLRRLPARAVGRAWRSWRGSRSQPERAEASLKTGLEGLFSQAPEPFPGRLVLFAAESSRHRGVVDRRLYWSRVTEHGLEVHLMPGNHNTMCHEPHVGTLALTLRRCLDSVEAARRA
jgi:thioesterase domain-containing protein